MNEKIFVAILMCVCVIPQLAVGQGNPFRPHPAGRLIVDAGSGLPATMPMTFGFVRSPDKNGPDDKGRFLIAINSGYGMTFTWQSKPQQTLSVIDLLAKPGATVIQTIYFPAPQSANVGIVFDTKRQSDGRYRLYVSGGFENKIWILSFDAAAAQPISPSNEPDKEFKAPFIDIAAFASNAPSPNYNDNVAAVYPTGIALSPDGETIYSANNLGDSLGIIADLKDSRRVTRIDLRRSGSQQFVYPYDVRAATTGGTVTKLYVSLWGDGSIAVVDPKTGRVSHITVGRHPTAMLPDIKSSRLYVVNSDADSVSVIDTKTDRVIDTINVRLGESELNGVAPEGIAMSEDGTRLFVGNAKANAVAVIDIVSGKTGKLLGFIPAGNYPSAVAVVGERLFVGNGKGTGMENSSTKVNESGSYPNMPNTEFPGSGYNRRGMYSASVVGGNISDVEIPDEKQLYDYTQQVMRNAGLLGSVKRNIFPSGKSPFKHVIYIIRENRTYDQIFGDLANAGDGSKADGDASVAIFGAGEAAKSPNGVPQNITPNARSLALRFGLLDRFFVNSEASPDGHNWATAAFSNDYIDKAFRWNYSGRGRTYDYEGFNRLPSFDPTPGKPPVALPLVFDLPATENDVAAYLKRYVPYLNGSRDIGEPETLYLWDAAKRAGLSYRAYGEFIATVSAEDVREVNTRQSKKYPDVSPTLTAFATKKTLEGNFSTAVRNFDQNTPDSFTTDSYLAHRDTPAIDPTISLQNADERFRGNSRFGAWRDEFQQFVSDRKSDRGDKMPALSILRLSNDHTAGLHKGTPTPQFYVAENDYAIGRVVEEVSNSPYWVDTAIFIVEDDAQDGPDHVDAHRSPAFVISAYNRPNRLIHEFHNTVSLIRTLELCLGISPMNFLDAHATPIDIFSDKADMRPFTASMPTVAADNLYPPEKPSAAMAYYMRLTDKQDLRHLDMADPRQLNEIIWYSVRRESTAPGIARLPAFDLMTAGLKPDNDENELEDDKSDE